MEVYQLTDKGRALAHNIYAPDNPRWRVIYYLNKKGTATKEQILNNVPEASGHTLYRLRRKMIITLVGKMAEV